MSLAAAEFAFGLRPWVKICGNTSLADALVAVEAGADALGFVFAPSPRRVEVAELAVFAPELPVSVEKIGVFVAASLDEILAVVAACGLSGVQLHSAVEPEFTAQLRARLGKEKKIIRVVHFGAGSGADTQAVAAAADPNADALLVDSRTATAVGGTGLAFDWAEARRSLFARPELKGKRILVAGGLKPDNVAKAIATLAPWGVDVASGVEAAPGKKDPAQVRAFVAQARAAAKPVAGQTSGQRRW